MIVGESDIKMAHFVLGTCLYSQWWRGNFTWSKKMSVFWSRLHDAVLPNPIGACNAAHG